MGCNDDVPKIRWARVGKQIAERVLLDWFCFYLCVPDREEMMRDRASQQRRRSGSAVSRQSTGPPHTTSPASYLYTGTYANTHRQNALSVNCKCLQHYVCSAFTWYYDSTTATFVISINVCVNVLFKWRKKKCDSGLSKENWLQFTWNCKTDKIIYAQSSQITCGHLILTVMGVYHSISKGTTQCGLFVSASYLLLLLQGVTVIILS